MEKIYFRWSHRKKKFVHDHIYLRGKAFHKIVTEFNDFFLWYFFNRLMKF